MDSALSFRLLADRDDRPSLRSLSELDGPLLLAEEDGRAIAAVDLQSGDVVAAPHRSSSDLIALLQLRRLELRVIGALVGG
jgi:hypothetical protein